MAPNPSLRRTRRKRRAAELQHWGAQPGCRHLDRPYPVVYTLPGYQLRETEGFANWLLKLHDARAKARILARLESARLGNLGDVRSVGGGVGEMRVDVGAGYQVYFTRRQRVVIVLLCGGDKSSQSTDIARAHRMAASIE